MQTSLNITYADSSLKKSTKSLTYINPEATNAQLETAASLFSAISQNSYVGAERIDRIDVSEPEPTPPTKTEPTLTLGNWQEYSISTSKEYRAEITYDGDGELYANIDQGISYDNSAPQIGVAIKQRVNDTKPYVWLIKIGEKESESYQSTLKIYASEGENYVAKEFTFTVNW